MRANTALEDSDLKNRVNGVLATKYEGNVKPKHLLEVVVKDLGFMKLSEHVKKPLKIKAVPYYGCLLTRPENKFDSPENPKSRTKLVHCCWIWGYALSKEQNRNEAAKGGRVVPWPSGFCAVRRKPRFHRKREKALLKSHHTQEKGVNYVRGKVAEIIPKQDGMLMVQYEDTNLGRKGMILIPPEKPMILESTRNPSGIRT
jgi:hypothetical protein